MECGFFHDFMLVILTLLVTGTILAVTWTGLSGAWERFGEWLEERRWRKQHPNTGVMKEWCPHCEGKGYTVRVCTLPGPPAATKGGKG